MFERPSLLSTISLPLAYFGDPPELYGMISWRPTQYAVGAHQGLATSSMGNAARPELR